ncbi:hypothetical protein Tco_0517074 [Tanacetum coccineum]
MSSSKVSSSSKSSKIQIAKAIFDIKRIRVFTHINDFLCLSEWTGAEVQEEPHLDVRPTLQRFPFYCTPPAAADPVIPEPAPEDLAVGTPSSKIVAKAEASQKRKASTSGAASSHIPLVIPLRSAVVIPPLGNQGRSSVAPAAEGSNTRDSRGKGIMVDDAAAPSGGVSQMRSSSGPTPSFRDVFDDAILTDFFPFSTGPYYATYHEDGVAGNFSIPGEMVHVESLSNNQLTAKMSVLHCMMMSHSGELLARYRGLNQSYYEYVLSTNSRLKGYEEKVASLTGLELQVSTLKKQERKKKIKSLTKSLDNLHSEVARLSAALNQATILEAEMDEEILRLKATPPEFSSFFQGQFQGLVWKFLASDEFSRVQGELLSLASSTGFERKLSMHQTKDEFVIVLKKMVNFIPSAQDRLVEASLFLEPEKLTRLANVLTPKDTRSSPPIAKGSTVTPVSKSLKLSINVVHASSVGVSCILDDVVEVVAVESERVSSGPTDVVVALSADGKGDVLIPSSVAGEEAVINSFKI